jgi:hypothetical protein
MWMIGLGLEFLGLVSVFRDASESVSDRTE